MRARLTIKVVPKASEDGIVGWMEEALKVRVTAPPEKDRANEAVRELLAEALSVPRSRIQIVAGHASRRKVVEIEGLDDEGVRRRLEPLPDR